MNMKFELLNDALELHDSKTDDVVELFERHYFNEGEKVIEYYTIDSEGNKRFFKATKDPEKFTEDERYRVLSYCLSSFDDDEVVNYHDLFLQFEFVEEVESL